MSKQAGAVLLVVGAGIGLGLACLGRGGQAPEPAPLSRGDAARSATEGDLAPAHADGTASAREAVASAATAKEDAPEDAVLRVTGRVVDPAGEPTRGVAVRLIARPDPSLEGDARRRASRKLDRLGKDRYRSMHVDDEGAYAFENVAPGFYDLGVAGMGTGMLKGKRALEVRTDLRIEFRLDGSLELGGIVGRVHPGPVRLELAEGDLWPEGFEYALGGIRTTDVPSNGAFRFTGLTPGHYRLRAFSEAHARTAVDFELHQSNTDVRLDLSEGLVFAGRVELGFETEHRSVWIAGIADGEYAWVDGFEDGEFRVTNLLPREYELEIQGVVSGDENRRVKRCLLLDLRQSVDDFRYVLEDDVPVWLDVDMPPGSPLTEGSLVVTSEDARTRAATRVRLFCPDGSTGYEVLESTKHGPSWRTADRLPLSAVSRGEWNVRLELLGYEPWERSLEVTSEATIPVRLVPRAGRMLRTSYKHRFYRIEARRAGSEGDWELVLWHDARIVATHTPIPGVEHAWLGAGRYDLRIASDELCERLVRDVVIEDSRSPLVIDYELERGVTIAGRVESASGSPLTSGFYLWRSEDGRWVEKPTKAVLGGAAFEIRGLRAGDYRATLDAAGTLVAATWTVESEDLVEQVVVAGP